MRGHNEGSLFRRKSGQWVALVTMRDGRRVSRWAKTRDEAKAELAELLRLRDAGAPITGRIRLGAYLERWVSDEHRLAPATRRKHESIVRVHLVPALGHIQLSELRVVDVEQALSGKGGHLSGLGPQSVRHVRATLRRALADAVRDGLVSRNVGGLARPPKLGNRERTILDANQARILIESTRGTRYGPLWTILVTTGLRISEALGLMWSSVDFGGNDAAVLESRRPATADARGDRAHLAASGSGNRLRPLGDRSPSITVRHQLARENGEWVRRQPKTAKGRRTIPLTPLGVEALRAQRAMQREWRFGDDARTQAQLEAGAGLGPERTAPRRAGSSRVHPLPIGAVGGPGEPREGDGTRPASGASVSPIDGLVFTTSKGHPLHETNTIKALQADLAAAGLPRVTQHDLRHSCATLLYSMGVPLETIADILGHSSSRITSDLYRHRVVELQQAASDAMQRALG